MMKSGMQKRVSTLMWAIACLGMLSLPLSLRAQNCWLNLPPYPANTVELGLYPYLNYPDSYSYVTAAVSNGVVAASPPLYSAWCVAAANNIDLSYYTFTPFSGYLFSSCDTNLNSELGQGNPEVGYPASCYVSPEVWKEVNYMLNHRDFTKPPYSGPVDGYNAPYFWDVQEALNVFVGGPRTNHYLPYHPAVIAALTNAAVAAAAGWQPQCGDTIAAVAYLDPTPFAAPLDDPQLILIEVPYCPVSFTKTAEDADLGCNPAFIPSCDLSQVAASSCCGHAVNLTCSNYDSVVQCRWTRVVTYTASDGFGNTATSTQTLTWTSDTNAPSFTSLPVGGDLGCNPATLPTDDSIKAQVHATDDCTQVYISVTHVDGGTPCASTRTFAISATDSCGNVSQPKTVVYTWMVDTTPPTIVCPADITTNLCAGGTSVAVNYGAILATDNCSTVTVVVNPPSGSSFPAGTNLVTITATDACGNASNCTFNVTVTACGRSALALVKTASPTNAAPGQPVTYAYAVTNIGTLTITNINILDDNGTPSDPTDDFVVNAAPFSLAPGEGTSFALSHITEAICASASGTNFNAGTLTVNVLPNGNVEVYYLQSQGLNDNRYGTNATAATGWPGGHKFNDLVGSDEATFLFTDGNGKQVLEFQEDYISAATSATFGDGLTITYPSGYGTLGPLGGDGKMLIGNSSNVLSCHTTFSDTLNQPGFTGFTVNSPPETSPLSNASVPPGWNYTNGYYVLISSNAFGAAGFGGVTIPVVHNSPSKNKLDKVSATNVCDCVVNTAQATAYQGTTLIATATATAQVCFSGQSGSSTGSGCNLTVGKVGFGPAGLTVPLKNNGSTTVYLTELDLAAWPSGTGPGQNGCLTQVTLNGPAAVWQGSTCTPPVTLTTTDFNATSSNTTQRSIPPGKQLNLTLKFQKAANKDASLYSGTVKFGTDCALSFP